MKWWRAKEVKVYKSSEWMQWLTVKESIDLIKLKSLMRTPKYRAEARRKWDKIRIRAFGRKRLEKPEFRVYMQAMKE